MNSGSDTGQGGATMAEFCLVAPVLVVLGLAIFQIGLVYHGKSTLNYATFEVARVGAVNNARLKVMRSELGRRLAPLQGGDGSSEQAALAMAKSALAVQDEALTRIRIINPAPAAFADWGVPSDDSSGRVIPNAHLLHRDHAIGATSGISLRDANLLKIRVTHGMDLKVPVAGPLLASALSRFDVANRHYYAQGKFPLTAHAVVRMQSEAWEQEVLAASEPPGSGSSSDGGPAGPDGSHTDGLPDSPIAPDPAGSDCEVVNNGEPEEPLISASDYELGNCLPNADSSLPMPTNEPDAESTSSSMNCL